MDKSIVEKTIIEHLDQVAFLIGCPINEISEGDIEFLIRAVFLNAVSRSKDLIEMSSIKKVDFILSSAYSLLEIETGYSCLRVEFDKSILYLLEQPFRKALEARFKCRHQRNIKDLPYVMKALKNIAGQLRQQIRDLRDGDKLDTRNFEKLMFLFNDKLRSIAILEKINKKNESHNDLVSYIINVYFYKLILILKLISEKDKRATFPSAMCILKWWSAREVNLSSQQAPHQEFQVSYSCEDVLKVLNTARELSSSLHCIKVHIMRDL